MGYTARQLLESCLGASVLPLYFLAPGYAAASITNILGYRSLRLLYRVAWALVFSTAIALIWTNLPYVTLSPHVVTLGFLAMGVAGFVCFVRDQRTATWTSSPADRKWRIGLSIGTLLLVLYCLLAPLGVEFHGSLYEHAASQSDWSVRIQLIDACLRGGSHPVNPMYAFRGHTVPLHTYYYWYVLCAQIAFLTGITAQPALIASCVAAAVLQVAVLVLALKTLRLSHQPIRHQMLALSIAMFALGLEVLIFLFDLLHDRFRSDPQLALSDHSPGLLYAFIWSPHHIAGEALCLAGLLVILDGIHKPRRERFIQATATGICYAAAAGTSTFVTGLFLLIGAALLILAIRDRDQSLIENIAFAGVVALVLTIPFAHTMQVAAAGVPASAISPIHFRVRYGEQAQRIAYHYFFKAHLAHKLIFKPIYELVRIVLMLLFLVCDLGLILYIAADRFRQDWARKYQLSRAEKFLWVSFILSSVVAIFITSANDIHNANDAGYHASSAMRVIAILWAVPLLLKMNQAGACRTMWQRLGVALFVLGCVSQCIQIFSNRFQVYMVDRGWITSLPVAERIPHVGQRFAQIRLAMDAAARYTAPNGIIQIYPHSRLAPELLMYSHRQFAASDEGCNIPFGGSAHDCLTMVLHFNALFGGNPHYHGDWQIKPRATFNVADASVPAFLFVCKENHLSAIVADYTSPAWQHQGTWIWALTPVYANPTARVYLCPAGEDTALISLQD